MIINGHCTYKVYEKGNFSIQTFKPMESVELPNGSLSTSITIKGTFLPSAPIDIAIEGDFDAKAYKGKKFTFNVASWEESKIPEKESILKYLTSLKGVGNVLARVIYAKFKNDTFKILDENIEILKTVPGIGKKKYQTISTDYLARGAAKQVYTYLYQYHVPNKCIERIYAKYKDNSLETITESPHKLYLQGFLSFDAAERLHTANNLDALSDERIQACIIKALQKTESMGNTYLAWTDLLVSTWKLLGINRANSQAVKKVGEIVKQNVKLLDGTDVAVAPGNLMYRFHTYQAELGTATNAKRLTAGKTNIDYSKDIAEGEKALGIKLSKEQAAAVSMALNNNLSIVTGGPGTGKTSFQKVLLYVYKKNFKKGIVMGAPTGRAARRMTESSGEPARTLHQILELMVTEDDTTVNHTEVEIDAGLVIVDEMSMVDIFLANELFSAVKNGTRLVCIGDVYQLPSVGCGAVLKHLIESGTIPVTKFTKVFRQAEGSIIASNAALINKGEITLEYGNSFQVIQKSSSEKIVEEVKKQYINAIKKYGQDEVVVLTPFRQKTVTGVNELNPVLKALCNPYPEKVTKYNKISSMEIYTGDKVMFTKNCCIGDDMLSNGDIGYITKITIIDNVQTAIVNFQDGRVVEIQGDDLKNLVQAYAMSIHKSQGSEYKCCIIIIDPKHSVLLKRNLIYTAITRSVEKAILIGDVDGKNCALNKGIELEDTNSRNSQLKNLLQG